MFFPRMAYIFSVDLITPVPDREGSIPYEYGIGNGAPVFAGSGAGNSGALRLRPYQRNLSGHRRHGKAVDPAKNQSPCFPRYSRTDGQHFPRHCLPAGTDPGGGRRSGAGMPPADSHTRGRFLCPDGKRRLLADVRLCGKHGHPASSSVPGTALFRRRCLRPLPAAAGRLSGRFPA